MLQIGSLRKESVGEENKHVKPQGLIWMSRDNHFPKFTKRNRHACGCCLEATLFSNNHNTITTIIMQLNAQMLLISVELDF